MQTRHRLLIGAWVLFAGCASIPYGETRLASLDATGPPGTPPSRVVDGDSWSVGLTMSNVSLPAGDWAPIETPLALGIEGDYQAKDWELKPEFGVQYSKDSATFTVADPLGGTLNVWDELSLIDVFAGVAASFELERSALGVRVGGGLLVRFADLDETLDGLSSITDSSLAPGIYVRGGPTMRVSDNSEIGLDIRALFSDRLEFNNVSFDSNSIQVGLVLRVYL